jgi:hypothetical protein
VKAGQIDHGEVTTTPPHPKASKTRAEVKAEAASAIKGGTLAPHRRRHAEGACRTGGQTEAEGGRRGAEVVRSARAARGVRA